MVNREPCSRIPTNVSVGRVPIGVESTICPCNLDTDSVGVVLIGSFKPRMRVASLAHRVLSDQTAFASVLEIDVVDQEVAFASGDHDLRSCLTHGDYAFERSAVATFGYLDPGKVARRLPDLGHSVGQVPCSTRD
jgi:hypothetical protein